MTKLAFLWYTGRGGWELLGNIPGNSCSRPEMAAVAEPVQSAAKRSFEMTNPLLASGFAVALLATTAPAPAAPQ